MSFFLGSQRQRTELDDGPGRTVWLAIVVGLIVFGRAVLCSGQILPGDERVWLAPNAIVVPSDGKILYAACGYTPLVLVVNLQTRTVQKHIPLETVPSGLALVPNSAQLVVTFSSGSSNYWTILDTLIGRQQGRRKAGHGVCAPVVGHRGGRLYTCNRFDNEVAAYDLSTGDELARIRVPREPIAAALTPDERFLVVANHLPAGRADAPVVAASVTVIDVDSFLVRTNILLPNGSTSLRGVAISPAGKWCGVTHNFARFQVPTTQVESGWMNDSALSLINLDEMRLGATVLLDEPGLGAANPWGIAWSADERYVCIAHSGTHEISLIDAPAMLQRVGARKSGGLIDDFDLLKGVRTRIILKGNGPRALTTAGNKLFVAEYFSDSISVVDLKTNAEVSAIQLSQAANLGLKQKGELLFHDATISYQHWQSCASCHPEGRSDGLNWDLLNDGIGNPKKTRSLVYAHQTPPAMTLGVRETAEGAVRSGLRNILFAHRPEADALAIDEYLKSLKPVPSPYLASDQLSPSARRGKELFESPEIECAQCHSGPFLTDKKSHAVGTENRQDGNSKQFDTPSLCECWRHSPYLHDGSAVTIREVLTTRNPDNQHGRTSHLSPREIDELAAYVLSL